MFKSSSIKKTPKGNSYFRILCNSDWHTNRVDICRRFTDYFGIPYSWRIFSKTSPQWMPKPLQGYLNLKMLKPVI
jgi:hypothetical protein